MISEFIKWRCPLSTYSQQNIIVNPYDILILISDNGNMLRPHPPLLSMGNSFSWIKNGKWMKMNQIKTEFALLNTTPGIPSVTAQSKILPYIQTNYACIMMKITIEGTCIAKKEVGFPGGILPAICSAVIAVAPAGIWPKRGHSSEKRSKTSRKARKTKKQMNSPKNSRELRQDSSK